MATDLTALLGGGGGGIKSVQRGFAGFNMGYDYENRVTDVFITAVNLSKSFLIFSNNTGDSSNAQSFVLGNLVSSTQITFSRASSQNSLCIAWEVVEFE